MSPRPSPRPSLWHNLGAFFGNVARGWREPIRPADPNSGSVSTQADSAAPRAVVNTTVMERRVSTRQGPITLRRTVIDEVEGPVTPPPEPRQDQPRAT